jgi:hypothetical protein
MKNYALVFLRTTGAQMLGHVGWGFHRGDGIYNVGAIENLSGMPIALPGHTGFWTDWVTDPVKAFRDATPATPYALYKSLMIETGDPQSAWETVLHLKEQPYVAYKQNCLDAVYDVLRAYGVPDLIAPEKAWNPNAWFLQLNGKEYTLEQDLFGPDQEALRELQQRVYLAWELADKASKDCEKTPLARQRIKSIKSCAQDLLTLADEGCWEEFRLKAEFFFRLGEI